MDLNKAMVIGRLTHDPESRTTPQGQTVCTFSVATSLVWKDANGQQQSKVEYHNVVAWRKLAETCAKWLKKGKRIYIEGRLQTRSWKDPQGATKYRTEIILDHMIMLDSKPADGTAAAAPSHDGAASPTEPVIEIPKEPAAESAPDDNIKVEDIPF